MECRIRSLSLPVLYWSTHDEATSRNPHTGTDINALRGIISRIGSSPLGNKSKLLHRRTNCDWVRMWPQLLQTLDLMKLNNQSIDTAPSPGDEFNNREVSTVQLVRIGASHYGIFAEEIAAIVSWKEPAPLPQAPRTVLGIVSIQGRMLTVLDLKSLGEDVSSDALSEPPTHLVALRGDEQLALAVDRVGSTIELESSDVDEMPQPASPPVLRAVNHEGLDVDILNVKELFSCCMQGRERRRRRF